MTIAAPDQAPGLRLKAVDLEGVPVLSAMVQDSIVAMTDFDWLVEQRRFVMLLNRFRWEAPAMAGEPPERVLAGLVIDQVTTVRHRRLDLSRRDQFLNLLSLQGEPTGAGAAFTLTFSEDRAIRIEASSVAVSLEDRGLAWPAGNRPSHDGAAS